MNLLVLNWNDLKNPFAGGAEVHLEELIRRLVSYGHTATLLCSGWKGCQREETIEGIRIIRCGNRYTFNFVAPLHLRRLARQAKFDLLIEDINKSIRTNIFFLKMKRLVVIPHLFATTVFQEINFVLGTYIFLAERPLVPFYRGCEYNVISESTAEDLIARGVPRGDITIVHCGIDRDLYSHDDSVPKYEKPTVIYLGRIKKYKSIQHLVVAFARVQKKLKEARLMIVGQGDYLPQLKSLVSSLHLDQSVEFPGFVSQERKIEIMRRSHVAVLPSLKEGWGLTNIESNSVGTAVLAANSPGLRDSVSDGVSGFLYEYGNIEELADKLERILTDDELRIRLQEGARQWASRFSWDAAAREFEKQLYDVVGDSR